MKMYLICTGTFFGLAGAAHLLRLFIEPGHAVSTDPGFFVENLALFVVGAAVAAWSATLLRRSRARADRPA